MYATKDSIVLFDMDGTLTEARKPAQWDIVTALKTLSKSADIGIVTGSPMSYLEQQCAILWEEIGSVSVDSISLFPCNGTQHYEFDRPTTSWKEVYRTNMKTYMGLDNYRQLVREIISLQAWYSDNNHDLPLTGNFISDRGSMINWCPVGRDASDNERLEFVNFDIANKTRAVLKEELAESLSNVGVEGVVCTLGGNTSLDIYPDGWDKTYVLRHLSGYKKIYFVGDKCEGHGNDRALYEALTPGEESFKTDSPGTTINIISDLITRV